MNDRAACQLNSTWRQGFANEKTDCPISDKTHLRHTWVWVILTNEVIVCKWTLEVVITVIAIAAIATAAATSSKRESVVNQQA